MNDYIKMLQQANIKIAEIKKERDVLTAFIIKRMPPIKAMSSIYETCKIVSDEVDLILKAHNLKQQAKALQFALENITNPDLIYSRLKALKEGK
jgi:hypothetical protein